MATLFFLKGLQENSSIDITEDMQIQFDECTSNKLELIESEPSSKAFLEAICYTQIAEDYNYPEICEKISTVNQDESDIPKQGYRELCYSKFSEYKDCSDYQYDFAKNNCYVDLAIVKGNPDLCNNINIELYEEGIGQAILDLCFSEIAIKLKDASICERISDGSFLKESCLSSAVS